MKFRKLPYSVLENKRPHRIFELVATHVGEQVENRRSEPVQSRLERIPMEFQVVYWLWRFCCEASLNGFEVLTLQSEGIYLPQIHASLEIVGATELVRRLEAAVPHARRARGAEFNTLKDKSWFDQFAPNPAFPTLQSVDEGVYPIINGLTDQVFAFVKSNARAFFGARTRNRPS
ncbi:MAG TPA: hypothetical protein VK797_29340 [Tepidisphaeraceae bacterium]|jgi:hypothetical protein|nr:hypothetical protein [Tepidisphaeraceae bacterium]